MSDFRGGFAFRSMHRVSEVYNGVSENKRKVLCLSCGEVGRIVFSDTEQIGFDEQILSEDYDEYEWEDGDDELAEKLESVGRMQSDCFRIAAARLQSVSRCI